MTLPKKIYYQHAIPFPKEMLKNGTYGGRWLRSYAAEMFSHVLLGWFVPCYVGGRQGLLICDMSEAPLAQKAVIEFTYMLN